MCIYVANFSAVALLKIAMRKHVNQCEHMLDSTKVSQPQNFPANYKYLIYPYHFPLQMTNELHYMAYQMMECCLISTVHSVDCLNQECVCQVFMQSISHAMLIW